MEDIGVAGRVRTALWLEHTAGMEVISFGPPAHSIEDCRLELGGTQLLVKISIKGSWIWLSAVGLDAGEAAELTCNFGDGPTGWSNARRLVLALERSGIKSLHPRPIRFGETGPDAYVID
jgi:hypothetical protein